MKQQSLTNLYVRSCAIGFVAAAAFVGMILWADVARLGTLIAGSEDGMLALLLLWVFNGIVFAGVQFGIAIMSLKVDEDQDDAPRGGAVRIPQAAPVRIRTDDRPRR